LGAGQKRLGLRLKGAVDVRTRRIAGHVDQFQRHVPFQIGNRIEQQSSRLAIAAGHSGAGQKRADLRGTPARSGWLEVDLGQETLIGRAVIKELGFHRTRQFAVEWKDGDVWKELARGTTIAGEKEIQFQPVTARYVRLNILKAAEVPTIEEFEIYPPSKAVQK
jgi:hypothetical protein